LRRIGRGMFGRLALERTKDSSSHLGEIWKYFRQKE